MPFFLLLFLNLPRSKIFFVRTYISYFCYVTLGLLEVVIALIDPMFDAWGTGHFVWLGGFCFITIKMEIQGKNNLIWVWLQIWNLIKNLSDEPFKIVKSIKWHFLRAIHCQNYNLLSFVLLIEIELFSRWHHRVSINLTLHFTFLLAAFVIWYRIIIYQISNLFSQILS